MEKIITQRVAEFTDPKKTIGAVYVEGQGTYIRLWAPKIQSVDIEWSGEEKTALKRDDDGYFTGFFPSAKPGDTYYFHCDGRKIPDPASRFQPEGVFGPSQVVAWNAEPKASAHWQGIPAEEWIIYEIHPGTFSEKHNFDGIIDDLPRLKDLGITTLEIMPVSQFPGDRNWGYDGVFPHAVQNTYGGPQGLKKLIKAAHEHGLAVILDVVYNHLGPEGNILPSLAPYTQDKYQTPWGDALNYDGEYNGDVRRYFLQSVWQWLTEYNLDGLRLDAIQMIFDNSPITFLQEVTALKKKAEDVTGRKLILIGETDMNDSRVLDPIDRNGFGFDGHWADDLHHALHAELTGDHIGYYADYTGPEQIARIYKNGVAFEGDYSPFRKRNHGKSYAGIDKRRLVYETQNHDQIGNRLLGDRLSVLLDFEKLKLSAACVLLSPGMPFLFMGEEFASERPFQYFISHSDPKLVEAVRDGRKKEWESFGWEQDPPDPASMDAFENCVLKTRNETEKSAIMQAYYKKLISYSKLVRSRDLEVEYADRVIYLKYSKDSKDIKCILSFNEQEITFNAQGWNCHLQSVQYNPGEAPGMFAGTDKLILPPFSATILER